MSKYNDRKNVYYLYLKNYFDNDKKMQGRDKYEKWSSR